MKSDQINELATALAKAQSHMKNATLNRVNPHYRSKYADLAAIIDAIRKPLTENNLSWSQTVEVREGGIVLATTLMHTSGQWIRSEYPLPVGAKPQEMGSATTYAKRYSLSAIVGISADDDDDAEAASRNGGNVSSVPSAKISQEQVEKLNAILDEVGADKPKFCKYMKISSLADLPASRFSEAIAILEQKRAAA